MLHEYCYRPGLERVSYSPYSLSLELISPHFCVVAVRPRHFFDKRFHVLLRDSTLRFLPLINVCTASLEIRTRQHLQISWKVGAQCIHKRTLRGPLDGMHCPHAPAFLSYIYKYIIKCTRFVSFRTKRVLQSRGLANHQSKESNVQNVFFRVEV